MNEFAVKATAGTPAESTPESLHKKLEQAEQASGQNIQRAKLTLRQAIRSLRDVKSSIGNVPSRSTDEQKPMTEALGSAYESLDQAATALDSIEEKLKEHGNVSNALNLARLNDIERENRLLEAAAVGLSARSLSHELHQYVRQLRGGVELVNERNKVLQDSKLKEAVRLLSSTTRELSKLVSAIDPLLPGSRSLKENITIQEFLRQFVGAREALADAVGVKLLLNIDPAIPDMTVRFSRSRLIQVIENLFQNSIYWLKRGPIPDRKTKQITITNTETGFAWSDSGPGISPSLESSIFEPFVSDKPASEGQGLGLHIVSTFLEVERCSIALASERNSMGRRFKFLVNLSPASDNYKQPGLL